MLFFLFFLATSARAETYHFAACDFVSTGGSWAVVRAVDGTREAVSGVMVKISQSAGDAGGYCNILRGTGSESSADILLNSASGSGISVSPSCEFRGQVDDAKSVHKMLSFGESATVDYGMQQREGLYFASPSEASRPDWVTNACHKVDAGVSGAQQRAACRLPADQGPGSLHGGWAKLPIPLVLDRQFYLHGEARALKRAVATWNRWAAMEGKVLFLVRDDLGAPIPVLKDCTQTAYTQAEREAVGVWRIDGTLGHENTRLSCGTNPRGGPAKILAPGVQGQTDWDFALGKIRGASVLLNLADYNRPGAPRLDLESEMLHELGHVLGLFHSCNVSGLSHMGGGSAPACFTDGVFSAPKDYGDAVMFPFLRDGELKRKLGDNDMARAACLY